MAARTLRWDALLGSLEVGKRADVLCVRGNTGDPHDHLIAAHEPDIMRVTINGDPRLGTAPLFTALGATGESLSVGGEIRRVSLAQDTQDPAVGKLSFANAREQPSRVLARLPELAKALERPPRLRAIRERRRTTAAAPIWHLAFDEIEATGAGVRARLPFGHVHRSGARSLAGTGSTPLSQLLQPLTLDALTVADDSTYSARLEAQHNLPVWLKASLSGQS